MSVKRAFIATFLKPFERFEDVVYWTESAGKARYKCFLDLKDAGFDVEFKDISIRRFPVADDSSKKDLGRGFTSSLLYDTRPAILEYVHMDSANILGVSACLQQ